MTTQFKGYGAEELNEHFGIEYNNGDDEVNSEVLADYLRHTPPEQTAPPVRAYLSAMLDEIRKFQILPDHLIWEALLKMDDVTMIRFFILLIPLAWT